jgi:hypothetical protein
MQNGHLDNNHVDFFEKFATKTEVHALESQVRELTKDYAGMAVVIQNLDNTVKEVNVTLKTLVHNKGVNDKLRLYLGKCGIGSFTFIIFPILVAHWSGLLKMLFKYMMS